MMTQTLARIPGPSRRGIAQDDMPATTPQQPAPRTPCAAAQALTGRGYLSWSQVNTMRRCSQQFFFRYIQHATPEFVPSSLKFGGAVHSALEFHFNCRMEGLDPSADELHHAYRQAWAQDDADCVPIRYNKGEDAPVLDDLAGRMLSAFAQSPMAAPHGQVIAVEETVLATVDPALPDVLAKVDLITQNDQGLHLTDFKTSRSRWNDAKAAENAQQLQLYRCVTKSLASDLNLPVRLSFGVLTKAKKPVATLIDIPVTSGQLSAIVQALGQVWSAIQGGNFLPNPSPMNCTTCPYRSRCPALGGCG